MEENEVHVTLTCLAKPLGKGLGRNHCVQWCCLLAVTHVPVVTTLESELTVMVKRCGSQDKNKAKRHDSEMWFGRKWMSGGQRCISGGREMSVLEWNKYACTKWKINICILKNRLRNVSLFWVEAEVLGFKLGIGGKFTNSVNLFHIP